MNKDLGYRDLFAYTYYLSTCIRDGQKAKNWKELNNVERENLLETADSAMKSFTAIQIGDPERN
jgi:hypothetical protein